VNCIAPKITPTSKPKMQRGIFRICPLYEYFLQNSFSMEIQVNLQPKQELSLGEAITPSQGCLKFRMYKPGKITKYGVLVRIVCEALSGYTCNMEIYAAKRHKLGPQYYHF